MQDMQFKIIFHKFIDSCDHWFSENIEYILSLLLGLGGAMFGAMLSMILLGTIDETCSNNNIFLQYDIEVILGLVTLGLFMGVYFASRYEDK